MSKDSYYQLIQKYIDGNITPEEELELLSWYRTVNDKKVEWVSSTPDEEEQVRARMLANILKNKNRGRVKLLRPLLSVAASILILFTLLILFYNHKVQIQKIASVQSKNIIGPGSDGATLILANGTKVLLNNSQNGLLAKQGGVVIRRSRSGQIIYDLSGNKNTQAIGFNTIVTARKQQYQVVLPDGSNVWLNAASSIKFPTTFTGNERSITLTGEAYFEVAKNKAKPFKVNVNGTQVEVLGTHFDVMSYSEEKSINTTLLEGSVKITKGANQTIIKPGQRAEVDQDIKVAEVDAEQSIAWKNGIFVFEDEDIHTIMNQIARWYDVDVEYRDNVDSQKFGGEISKYKDVSQILKKMELTNTIHFKIEGRRIIVMK